MLSPRVQTNLQNAVEYFGEHLSLSEYYSESNRIYGEWIGFGAERLGLVGTVKQHPFVALCENRHPLSGARLTQRRNHERGDAGQANRRVFYDFVFSPPKSVSIAALVAGDERIVSAHNAAIRAAVAELERFAGARVRGNRQNADRRTGNVVCALFQHETSRALDPHLHTHCIVFNATFDATEERWKALQNLDMLRAQKFVENVYYHELARGLRSFGYTIINSHRGDFELAEVTAEVRQRFSKRHFEIDEKMRSLFAAHPEKQSCNDRAVREHIAHKERSRKGKLPGKRELQSLWKGQLSAEEQVALQSRRKGSGATERPTVADAFNWAEDHLFERRSVVYEHELLRHALAAGRGGDFSTAEMRDALDSRGYLRRGEEITKRDVLAREWAIVEAARNGVGQCLELCGKREFAPELSDEQRRALEFLLASRNRVTLFRGGAGVGKSFLLRTLQEILVRDSATSIVVAPQRQQVIDLQKDGLSSVYTVSEFLERKELPRDAIVIVDEAGQIGGKQMLELLRSVEASDGRIILSGDTRQHGPVEASDALRAIERYSGLQAAELHEIRRQDPARGTNAEERERIRHYREAVRAAAAGDLSKSMEELEKIGAVIACDNTQRDVLICERYTSAVAQRESALVVSQTRSEVWALNEMIRSRLRDQMLITGPETEVEALVQVDMTNAQKRDIRHYPAKSVVVFNRKRSGIDAGQRGSIIAMTKTSAIVEVSGKIRRLPFNQLHAISVFTPAVLRLCPGDVLQIKTNTSDASGRKLANGEIVAVEELRSNGEIKLKDGRVIPKAFRQFSRGYAVTSYGSQGKTVDHVIFADAGDSASNAQQWYVTISRGRKSAQILTQDMQCLRAAATKNGDRKLAIELSKVNAVGVGQRAWRLVRRVCQLSMRIWSKPVPQNEIAYDQPTRNHQKPSR